VGHGGLCGTERPFCGSAEKGSLFRDFYILIPNLANLPDTEATIGAFFQA